jgi:CubicO group peptidase (beta-lactamase class C family)
MSCTKVLTSIAVAMAVDRGYFQYGDLMIKYWPAFGKNGKESTTIEQIMRHEGGLPHFGAPALQFDDLADFELLAKRIENATQDYNYHVETDRAYHAVTRCHSLSCLSIALSSSFSILNPCLVFFFFFLTARGLILNVLFSKAVGVTIGQFVRTEISPTLGSGDNLFLGVTRAEFDRLQQANRIAPLQFISPAKLIARAVGDALFSSDEDFDPDARRRLKVAIGHPGSVQSKQMHVVADGAKGIRDSATFDFLSVESPSSNGLANARVYATIAGILACGGGSLISESTLRQAEGGGTCKIDAGMQLKTTFSQGGFCLFNNSAEDARSWPKPMDGFVGWGGIGGSLFAWHPELQLGVSYTPNGLHSPLTSILGAKDPRCLHNLAATLACVRARIEAEGGSTAAAATGGGQPKPAGPGLAPKHARL